MVPSIDVGKMVKVQAKVLGIGPCGCIDSCQHRVGFLTAPVGTGDGKELECIGVEFPGGLHVRSAAEIRESALIV